MINPLNPFQPNVAFLYPLEPKCPKPLVFCDFQGVQERNIGLKLIKGLFFCIYVGKYCPRFVYSPSLVFVCLSVSVCLSVCLSVSLPVSLSVSLSICLSVCVSLSLSTFVFASLKKKLSFLTTSYTEKYQPVVKDF